MRSGARGAALWVALAVATVWAGSSGAGPAAAPEADLGQVRQVLERYDKAMAAKDIDGLGAVFSRDPEVTVFGPDLTDRWVGWSAIKSGYGLEFKRVKKMTIEAQPAAVHLRGNIAWFERRVVLTLVAQEGETALLARSTGVLEKNAGQWQMVQLHTSIGAPRDAGPRD